MAVHAAFGAIVPPILDSMGARKRLGTPRPLGHYVCGQSIIGSEPEALIFNPLGVCHVGVLKCGDYFLLSGVYRHTKTPWRHFYSRMPYMFPANPRTVPQQANRQKMIDGVAAWHALGSGAKTYYNRKAFGKHMAGFNVFLHDYLTTH
jgi:hypothetical protein